MSEFFQNTSEMISVFEKPMRIAISHVITKMIEEVQNEIDSFGVGTVGFNSVYEGTGEFREAWTGTVTPSMIERMYDVAISSVTAIGEMGYDSSLIKTSDEANFIHGSRYSNKDAKELLPYIIFEGKAGDFFGNGFWTKERDAWDKSCKRFEKSFSKWLKEGFAISGISIK